MKPLLLSILGLIIASPVLLAQETVKSGMPTIEVDSFTRLENRLMNAVVGRDRLALDGMLAPDFELRTSRSGGEITLRDEWIQAATATYKVRSFRISRLTVRPLGKNAVVNFFCEQRATASEQHLNGNFFIVDLWQKVGTGWKLSARYSAGPSVSPNEPSNTKTKE
jgi:hypothetical protein